LEAHRWAQSNLDWKYQAEGGASSLWIFIGSDDITTALVLKGVAASPFPEFFEDH
jgi:hypothetical protein